MDHDEGKTGWSIKEAHRHHDNSSWSEAHRSMLFSINGREANNLVINITNPFNSYLIFDEGIGYGTRFRTGDHEQGYIPTELALRWGAITGNIDQITVSVWEGNSENPETLLYTLGKPADLVSGNNIFTFPANSRLEARADYWVVVMATAAVERLLVTTSDDDSGKSGWSIGNITRKWNGTSWVPSTSDPMMFKVIGTNSDLTDFQVSNLGEADSSTRAIANNDLLATKFTTGSDTYGYTLDRLRLDWASMPTTIQSSQVKVRLYSASGNDPDAQIAEFTNPSQAGEGKEHLLLHPAGDTNLEKDTDYFILVKGLGAAIGSVQLTTSDTETSETGWSIGNDSRKKTESDTNWSAETGSLKMSIFATAKDEEEVIITTDPPPMVNEDTATLVSNTGETAHTVTTSLSGNLNYSQKFHTGDVEGGYLIDRFIVRFSSPTGTVGNMTVTVNQDSSDNPGAVIATLTNPDSLATGDNIFTPSQPMFLAKNRNYFLKLASSSTIMGIQVTTSDDETGENGWSIHNTSTITNFGTSSTDDNSMLMEVQGRPASMAASNLDATPGETTTMADTEKMAQKFTTGDHAEGYIVESVTTEWTEITGSIDDLLITVSNSGGENPSSRLVELTNPASLVAGYNVFTADTEVVLEPETDYFVQLVTSGSVGKVVRTESEADDGMDGGAVANSRRFYNGSSWENRNDQLKIGVRATRKAALPREHPRLQRRRGPHHGPGYRKQPENGPKLHDRSQHRWIHP